VGDSGPGSASHSLSNEVLKIPAWSSGGAQVAWSCCIQCQAAVSSAAGASSDCAVTPALPTEDRNFTDMSILPVPPGKTHPAQCCILCSALGNAPATCGADLNS